MKSISKVLMLSFGLFAGINTAIAASPVGQWSVTFYLEPALATGGTQGICYVAGGTWYSTTFSGWNGDWFQKGDRFRWYGNTSSLGTAEFGQFITNTTMSGEFAHFDRTTPPITSTRGNWYGRRVKTTCDPPAAQALEVPGAATVVDPAAGK